MKRQKGFRVNVVYDPMTGQYLENEDSEVLAFSNLHKAEKYVSEFNTMRSIRKQDLLQVEVINYAFY